MVGTIQNTTNSTINTVRRLLVLSNTGTASVTAGSNVVTGTSTAFVNQLEANDDIFINGERKTITLITSNTSLTVDSAFASTATGQAITSFPVEAKGTNKIISVQSHDTNTATLFVGASTNLTLDGSDISSTSKTMQVQAGLTSDTLVFNDLYNVFTVCGVASQRYTVIIKS